jgi:hypothetical protein
MAAERRAHREEQIAAVEESTEQRMHAVADLLPDSGAVHQRANELSERAQSHRRRAEAMRSCSDDEAT